MTTKELLDEGWKFHFSNYLCYKNGLKLEIFPTFWKIYNVRESENPHIVFYGLSPNYEQYKILMELL